MHLNSWPGLVAILLAILSFYITTYAVIALNVGWRFGYWLAGSIFGALMVLLSIFWVVNPVGPRGEEPRWIPLAASDDRITQASFEDQTLSTPTQYPTGPWQPPSGDLLGERDALSSAVSTCISTDPEKLPEEEQEACSAAQKLMPAAEDIPVIEGSAVAVLPDVGNVRFTVEGGATLGQAEITPITHDARVARNPEAGKALGGSFRLLAILNKGSLRLPAYFSLLIFLIFAAFHLVGLHRAEQRKLSPIAG